MNDRFARRILLWRFELFISSLLPVMTCLIATVLGCTTRQVIRVIPASTWRHSYSARDSHQPSLAGFQKTSGICLVYVIALYLCLIHSVLWLCVMTLCYDSVLWLCVMRGQALLLPGVKDACRAQRWYIENETICRQTAVGGWIKLSGSKHAASFHHHALLCLWTMQSELLEMSKTNLNKLASSAADWRSLSTLWRAANLKLA